MFKLPFTGLFVGGAAVVLLSLLAYFGATRRDILKATAIVIAVKAFVSPHTPVAAYAAVAVQGMLGCLLPGNARWFMPRVLVVAVTALLLSAVQKLILLTLLFGKTFWASVDLFISFAVEQIAGKAYAAGGYSAAFAAAYLALHAAGGIVTTILVYRLVVGNPLTKVTAVRAEAAPQPAAAKKKRRIWLFKPSSILLVALTAATYFITMYYPAAGKIKQVDILIMVIRSTGILLLWFLVISPFITKAILRRLKPESRHTVFLKEMERMFPLLRGTASAAWKQNAGKPLVERISNFGLTFIGSILLLPAEETE